jgi:hypothetical protein
MMQRLHWEISASFALLFCLLCGSCDVFEPDTIELWTDRSEFAWYAQYFNASQSQYHVEVTYTDSVANDLLNAVKPPDIVVGNWLKSSTMRTLFRPLDDLFKDAGTGKKGKTEKMIAGDFYPKLLALGIMDEVQYLLPVAFNLPALVFSQSNAGLLSNQFTLDLDEIKTIGMGYNIERAGVYSRIGFSPAWNNSFLFVIATLYDAAFQEAEPITWDNDALERAIDYISTWIREANTSIQAEDDFSFKYRYDPPEKLVLSGRILFTYMDSAEFFTLPPEQRARLDFRWITGHASISLAEETVYYGICHGGRAKKASNAFTQWFFRADTQRLLLEKSRDFQLNETLFGIAGGFSAMRTVTEQVFPRFYPGLLGHIPPEEFLSPPKILPHQWTALKEKVILPYLHDRIRNTDEEEIRSLERRITEWYRINGG